MSGAVVSRAERIARLNDLARSAMGIACVVVATEGIRALPETDQSRLRELVETFDAFTPENDPYGARGLGAIYQGVDGVWSTSRPVDVAETVKEHREQICGQRFPQVCEIASWIARRLAATPDAERSGDFDRALSHSRVVWSTVP
jgi:hypothetical protein